MWSEIIISISTSIGEALFDKVFGLMNLSNNKKLLEKLSKKALEQFADTSLDSDEFHNFVKSETFARSLRMYYFMFANDSQNNDVINGMCNIIKERCPKAYQIDVRHFIKEVDNIFNEITNKIIMSDEQSFALMSMIVRANRIVVSKISESEENLKRYLNNNTRVLKFDDKLIDTYHKNCILEYGTMNFTGIVGAERKSICKLEELYVKNDFFVYSKNILEIFGDGCPNNNKSRITFKDFFKYSNRIVILGGAGFGKSTCLNYLFCNYEKEFESYALKLKLNLKDYANFITEKSLGILDCLCNEFIKRIPHHLINSYDVKSTLSKHLYEGDCFVIFDALDEVDSQFSRDKVRDEISNFCNVYFLNKFIITSREVGYLKNKFDDSFLHLRIGLFTGIQIKNYGLKWFKLNTADTKSYNKKLTKFMSEVDKAKCLDLIRNPIILVLALIVFNSENNLPHKRVEFYKKCIDTFLVEREKRKEAFDMRGIECIRGDNLILPRMSYYKFEKDIANKDYKLTNDELKSLLFNALEVVEKRNWIEPINRFANYLIERTELIREVDVDRYDFAHKTFSEYFLAIYFTKCIDINILLSKLDNWIGDSNYDELANLIIEVVIEENLNYQHNILLNYLIDNLIKYSKLAFDEENPNFYHQYSEKTSNYLSILSKLYYSNSLLPKFVEKYHSILLFYPECIQYKSKRRIIDTFEVTINFDKDLFFEMYKQSFDNDSKDFTLISRILFCYRNIFNERKDKINNDIHKKSLELFGLLSLDVKAKPEKKKFNKSEKALLGYFCNEKFDDVKKSDIIFYSLLRLLLIKNEISTNQEFCEKLCLFEIDRSRSFTIFINPDLYFNLLIDSDKSSISFILLLMSLVMGSKDRIFWLIEYAKNTKEQMRFESAIVPDNISSLKDYYKEIEIRANSLHYIISNNNSYNEFVDKIKRAGVYNKNYECIYTKVFLNIYKVPNDEADF